MPDTPPFSLICTPHDDTQSLYHSLTTTIGLSGLSSVIDLNAACVKFWYMKYISITFAFLSNQLVDTMAEWSKAVDLSFVSSNALPLLTKVAWVIAPASKHHQLVIDKI